MPTDNLSTLERTLLSINTQPENAWLYLPLRMPWTLDSRCAVLISEEVPLELEDDPQAGIPMFAKQEKLKQVLPVSIVQDIVRNATTQKPDADSPTLLKALLYYYNHDAFATLA